MSDVWDIPGPHRDLTTSSDRRKSVVDRFCAILRRQWTEVTASDLLLGSSILPIFESAAQRVHFCLESKADYAPHGSCERSCGPFLRHRWPGCLRVLLRPRATVRASALGCTLQHEAQEAPGRLYPRLCHRNPERGLLDHELRAVRHGDVRPQQQ